MAKPRLVKLNKIGSDAMGFISVVEKKKLPFTVKRVYWTYHTPTEIIRGHHAHKKLEQIIVAVHGSIKFTLQDNKGKEFEFLLNHPQKALYIPKGYWRTISFSKDAVLLCLASEKYDAKDYIRDYKLFMKVKEKKKKK